MIDTDDTLTGEIIELAQNAATFFHTERRSDGEEFVTYIDDRPQWVEDLTYDAHKSNVVGDLLPDDYRYATIWSALQVIAEAGADDDSHELCDYFSEPDIYTSDLLAWLSSNINRYAFCDEYLEVFGVAAENTLTLIGAGQMMEKREIFESVLQSLAEQADTK